MATLIKNRAATGLNQKPQSMLLRLVNMMALARQRRALMHLDAAQLEDIGVSATQAETEAKRLPWDAPANWKG